MTTYCALLRGIGPGNPNMHNDKLRDVFSALGFANVSSVLASGNIIFTDRTGADVAELEAQIQAALQQDLSIGGGTILRSREELETLVATDPFEGMEHAKPTYLTVTFLKVPLDPAPEPFPSPELPAMEVRGYNPGARAILAVTDTTAARTPDFMGWLERQFGKDMTTRTWLTVHRILKRMREA